MLYFPKNTNYCRKVGSLLGIHNQSEILRTLQLLKYIPIILVICCWAESSHGSWKWFLLRKRSCSSENQMTSAGHFSTLIIFEMRAKTTLTYLRSVSDLCSSSVSKLHTGEEKVSPFWTQNKAELKLGGCGFILGV